MFSQDKLLGIIPMDWRWDLTQYKWVRDLFRSRWFPLIPIIINVMVFTVILMAGFVGGLSAGNFNFGIMIVWIVWWVLLMLVFVPVFARFWCMICPLPIIGDWIQRGKVVGVNNSLFGLRMRLPKWLSNMWMMNILFLVTTFFSAFLTTRPLATFVLLGLIVLLSIFLAWIYDKRVFCMYVCPVSGFQGLYSNMAMSEIRHKDAKICEEHKKKGCVVGTTEGYGCPWLQLPYSMSRNTYCGMCLECFKTCEYDNMAFNIRPPGTDLLVDEKRGLDEAWKAFIMLGCAVVFYVVMQGPWGLLKDWSNMKNAPGYFAFIGMDAVFNLIFIPALFGLCVYIAYLLAKRNSSKERRPLTFKTLFVNYSYTLVPLGLAAWGAFSLGILFPNSTYVLHTLSDPFAWGWNLFGTANFPWTPFLTGLNPYLQIIILIGGALIALDFAAKLSMQTLKDLRAATASALPIFAFLIGTTIFLIWLYTG